MQQHQLKPVKGSRQRKTRLGIGDTFAGRGAKGQKSRVGGRSKFSAGFEGGQTPLIRRLPKLGGFTNVNRIAYQAVNLADLNTLTGEVTPASLKKAGLIRSAREYVKILGNGELTAKLAVSAHAASEKAKVAIEKAGGSLTVLPIRSKELRGKKPVRKTPIGAPKK